MGAVSNSRFNEKTMTVVLKDSLLYNWLVLPHTE